MNSAQNFQLQPCKIPSRQPTSLYVATVFCQTPNTYNYSVTSSNIILVLHSAPRLQIDKGCPACSQSKYLFLLVPNRPSEASKIPRLGHLGGHLIKIRRLRGGRRPRNASTLQNQATEITPVIRQFHHQFVETRTSKHLRLKRIDYGKMNRHSGPRVGSVLGSPATTITRTKYVYP